MLTFVVSAWFKAGADLDWDAAHPGAYVAHLETFVPRVKLEGALYDRDDVRCGMFAILECESFDDVERFLATSPYQLAGLYDQIEVHRFHVQSGHLT